MSMVKVEKFFILVSCYVVLLGFAWFCLVVMVLESGFFSDVKSLKNPRRVLIVWCREQNICPYRGGFCDSKSCSWVDVKGNVRICSNHPNSSGRFTPRKTVSVLRGVRL